MTSSSRTSPNIHYEKILLLSATISRGDYQIIPTGESLAVLEHDYAAMLEDGLLPLNQPSFIEIIDQCLGVQNEINRQAKIANETSVPTSNL